MRVGVIALLQESNTFVRQQTTLEHFAQDVLLCGAQVHERFAGAHHELGGFFAGLDAASIEAVPLFAARALPFGVITTEAYRELLARLLRELEGAPKLDGLLVAAHGATVSQSHPDADGHWLMQLRRRVGPELPIIATLDPHANLSRQMTAACDALIAYRTNPHLDQQQRGLEAGQLMARTLRGDVRPTMAAAFPPLAINIECQHTSSSPCRELLALADQMLARGGVLTNSMILGFPYADVAEMGAAAIVVTDNDAALAQQLADELAGEMWGRRTQMIGELIHVEAALDRAVTLEGPVCLLDMGDNVGGGSPADSTALAIAMHDRQIPQSFVCLCDPQCVDKAESLGVGGAAVFRIGGKDNAGQPAPLEGDFQVLGLHDGRFEERQPRHGGFASFDQGRTAIVRSKSGLTVMITSRRAAPFSLQQLISCGLQPEQFHLIVAKGVHAPLAAYEPVCKHFIRVDTPGVTSADMRRLQYRNRRRPMFPFEPETVWQPDEERREP